ncbi:MAG: hypothetical protein KDA20_04630 [Phycisphaerales bacterium]|nr:hypothetical protein [Phycisphaerales bacterium]
MSDSRDTPRFLDPTSAQAVNARFDATATRTGDLSPAGSAGTAKLDALLRLLDTPVSKDDSTKQSLIATICARAAAQRQSGLAGAIQPTQAFPALSSDSEALTDACLAGQAAPGNTAAALLALLDTNQQHTESRRAHVVNRTLDAIQRDIERQGTRFRLSEVRDLHLPRGRFSFRDLVASAAAVLIGAAIIWPSLTAMKANDRQAICTSNLQQAGLGVGLFTNAQDQRLPSIDDRAKQPVWWNVGEPKQSHSANIFRLVAGGYATMHSLACPCNACAPTNLLDPDEKDWRAPEEVSYSYLLFERAPRISEPGIRLLLVDKSPVVERARNGETFQIDLNSRNHAGRGQNALMSDLSVQFLTRPTVDGDNIWAPRSMEERDAAAGSTPMQGFTLRGTELPADLRDIFVGP